eukprot:320447-Chlamydomonas_euryale.AAC.1
MIRVAHLLRSRLDRCSADRASLKVCGASSESGRELAADAAWSKPSVATLAASRSLDHYPPSTWLVPIRCVHAHALHRTRGRPVAGTVAN